MLDIILTLSLEGDRCCIATKHSLPVFSSLPKLVSTDDLLAEIEEVNSDGNNYSNNMCDTTAEWQSKVKPFS